MEYYEYKISQFVLILENTLSSNIKNKFRKVAREAIFV